MSNNSNEANENTTATLTGATARADAQRNRAILLETARKVFAEEGANASLTRIVERSGLGRGSLYRHFPNKFHLISAIFDENFEELEECLRRSKNSPNQFTEVFSTLMRQMYEARKFISLLFSDNDRERDFSRDQQNLRDLLERLCLTSHANGSLEKHFQPADILVLITMVTGVAISYSSSAIQEHLKHALRLLNFDQYFDETIFHSRRRS